MATPCGAPSLSNHWPPRQKTNASRARDGGRVTDTLWNIDQIVALIDARDERKFARKALSKKVQRPD